MMMTAIMLFLLAGIAEIGGGYLVWLCSSFGSSRAVKKHPSHRPSGGKGCEISDVVGSVPNVR